jgi:predicted nuclease of predicted toxin-antitoxin system
VPVSHKLRFLLDENVSSKLKNQLVLNGHEVKTVQDLNRRGVKNSELMELARVEKRILITYDKDFVYFKHRFDNYLIIIDIHPLIDENVIPIFQNFLKTLDFSILKDNFIILKKEKILLKKKD